MMKNKYEYLVMDTVANVVLYRFDNEYSAIGYVAALERDMGGEYVITKRVKTAWQFGRPTL